MPVDGPLAGVRVLELGHYIAAPFCTQILADQGADVIKVEQPGGGPRRNSDPVLNKGGYFNMLNRNKRSIAVDLKSESGRQLLDSLVEHSDVLVTNFAAGVPQRLGIGYERLSQVNRRLVYVHATGFGNDSPYSQKPAFDGIIQAMSGLLHLTGQEDGPPVLAGVFVPDHVTGLYAALAVMFGLRRRDITDEGSFVDLSMLDSMLTLLGATLSEVADLHESPHRTGGRVRRSYAGIYSASDGFVYLAPMAPKMWEGVASVVQAPELLDFYSTKPGTTDQRMPERDRLDAIIDRWTSSATVEEVVERMSAAGVPCSPIMSIEQIVADPNVAHRHMLQRVPVEGGQYVTVAGSPLPVDESTFSIHPPRAGEHTEEIVTELAIDLRASPQADHHHRPTRTAS